MKISTAKNMVTPSMTKEPIVYAFRMPDSTTPIVDAILNYIYYMLSTASFIDLLAYFKSMEWTVSLNLSAKEDRSAREDWVSIIFLLIFPIKVLFVVYVPSKSGKVEFSNKFGVVESKGFAYWS